MFTGIIEETGTLDTLQERSTGARLRIHCSDGFTQGTQEGDSIAVNGVCLTALDIAAGAFSADLAPETLRRTNLGDLRPTSIVNLERPLLASGRLHGHVVQGHVDGTGEVLSIDLLGGENYWLRVRIPDELDRYVVSKGSIAIDGISLTVAAIENKVVSVTIIPHTFAMTALSQREPGMRVNIECDIFAKYLEKMTEGYRVTT